MGILIGLLGSGGSIITIPILVYGLQIAPSMATTYSLLIVATTSAVGASSYIKKKEYNSTIALLFVIPSIISVYITRHWVVPNIPETLLLPGEVLLSKDHAIMLLFATLMLAACYSMIRSISDQKDTKQVEGKQYGWLPIEGLIIGFITGLTGAGGGFLILPSLVVWNKLPMRKAVGTSLLIIALNSAIGFWSDTNLTKVNPNIIIIALLFTGMGVLGGSYINSKVQPAKLKPAFGWFIFAMGLLILFKELSITPIL